jgi:CubicO group peptidase (beta-lactamase class C family)
VDTLLEYLAAIAMPGGGLWSTAGDLVRFARAYLRAGSLDGARLLPPAFVALMGREQTRGILEPPADGVGPDRDPRYALGWGKPGGDGGVPCTEEAIEHGGATGTRLFIDPGTDLAVVVLANRWDVAETSRAVVAAVHSALVPA